MDLVTLGVQLLNAIQYGMVLFLVASGLTLVFGILGIPLGIRKHRTVKYWGFTIGLAVVITYYLLRLGGDAFDRLAPGPRIDR